jgi:hypothetical protein
MTKLITGFSYTDAQAVQPALDLLNKKDQKAAEKLRSYIQSAESTQKDIPDVAARFVAAAKTVANEISDQNNAFVTYWIGLINPQVEFVPVAPVVQKFSITSAVHKGVSL